MKPSSCKDILNLLSTSENEEKIKARGLAIQAILETRILYAAKNEANTPKYQAQQCEHIRAAVKNGAGLEDLQCALGSFDLKQRDTLILLALYNQKLIDDPNVQKTIQKFCLAEMPLLRQQLQKSPEHSDPEKYAKEQKSLYADMRSLARTFTTAGGKLKTLEQHLPIGTYQTLQQEQKKIKEEQEAVLRQIFP